MNTRKHFRFITAAIISAAILCGCTKTDISSSEDINSTSTSTSTYSQLPAPVPVTSSSSAAEPEPEPLPSISPDYQAFENALSEAFSKYYVDGMSVAVFKDNEILHTYGKGFADIENEIPFTADTRSRVASTSKMITSMVMMTLYDEGKITPDSVLSEVTGLPFDAEGKEPVKLWHLMTHTAGFKDTTEFDDEGCQDLKFLLKNSRTKYNPGEAYLYTNFGAGTAGAVIERITGEWFFDYADRVLFKPLGMDAGYGIEMISDKKSVAKLYNYKGVATDVQNWNRKGWFYRSIGLGNSCYIAQCELIINVKDLARLGMLMTNNGTLDGVTILSEEAVDLMEKRYFSTYAYDMGLSIRIYDDLIENHTIYGHNGTAFGALTGLYYDPDSRTGIAIITNGCHLATDRNGFYSFNKMCLQAAYDHVFDTGDFAKPEETPETSDNTSSSANT